MTGAAANIPSSPVADIGFDEAACLARVRAGDETAARELFQHLHPLVARLVRAHLPRRASEEDLCQMSLIKVFRHLHQYAGAAPLAHWVSRITVNTCYSQLQAEKIRPELRWSDLGEAERAALEAAAATATSAGELDAVHRLGSRELIETLLARLEPADRLVVTLLHLEERPVAEVAGMTGWSVPLVKVRAFRARRKLAQLARRFLR